MSPPLPDIQQLVVTWLPSRRRAPCHALTASRPPAFPTQDRRRGRARGPRGGCRKVKAGRGGSSAAGGRARPGAGWATRGRGRGFCARALEPRPRCRVGGEAGIGAVGAAVAGSVLSAGMGLWGRAVAAVDDAVTFDAASDLAHLASTRGDLASTRVAGPGGIGCDGGGGGVVGRGGASAASSSWSRGFGGWGEEGGGGEEERGEREGSAGARAAAAAEEEEEEGWRDSGWDDGWGDEPRVAAEAPPAVRSSAAAERGGSSALAVAAEEAHAASWGADSGWGDDDWGPDSPRPASSTPAPSEQTAEPLPPSAPDVAEQGEIDDAAPRSAATRRCEGWFGVDSQRRP